MGATAATGVRTPAFRGFGYIKVLALGLLVAKAKKGKGGKKSAKDKSPVVKEKPEQNMLTFPAGNVVVTVEPDTVSNVGGAADNENEEDKQTELVYAKSRFEGGFSPLVVYLPTKLLMFKMMRSTAGCFSDKDLWFNQG